MKIKIWGARGSIPSPITPQEIRDKMVTVVEGAKGIDLNDPMAVRTYIDGLSPLLAGTAGGNTSCVSLRSGTETIIIDAGSGIRPLGQELLNGPCGRGQGILHIFFSHPHWDHIQGWPFFLPAHIPGNRIYLYSVHDLETPLIDQMKSATFPISFAEMRARSTIEFVRLSEGQAINIGDLHITHMRLQHPGYSYAYRFETQGRVFIYASDIECKSLDEASLQPYVHFFNDADLLIFDSQFTLRESLLKVDWGHSSALVGAEIARRAGVKRLVLFHHDPTTSDAELQKISEQTVSYQTTHEKKPSTEILIGREELTIDLTPSKPFLINPDATRESAVLQVNEDFDQHHVPEVIEALEDANTQARLPRLVVDLVEVKQLNIAALRSLIDLRYAWQNRPMALARLSAQAREVIQLANCLDLFAIYPTVETALAALEARETLHLPGQLLKDRYHIEAKLREADIGTIFKAYDTRLDRSVALLVLSPTLSQLTTQRLLHQAPYMARLQHPNIVTLFDSDEDRGLAFLVMEYKSDVQTLRVLIDQGNPPPAFQLADFILQALEYAHSKNTIHGNLRPENILINETVRLADFGLGLQQPGQKLTEPPLTIRSPYYLSPEQIEGKSIDARTDLYILGVILYELVTGRRPFEGEGMTVLEKHLNRAPTPPRQLNPKLSPSCEHLILRLLAKDPDQRYATANEVRQVLSNLNAEGVVFLSGDLNPVKVPPPEVHQEANQVTDELAVERVTRRRSKIFGREAEVEYLLKLWQLAASGQGQIMLVGGEAGIGKTSLCEELINHIDHGVILIGRCSEYEGSPPYQPFVEIGSHYLAQTSPELVRQQVERTPAAANLAAMLAPIIPDLYEIMPTLKPLPPLEPDQEQLRLRSSMVQFIEQAAVDRPWLIFVDDLHWSDPSSLQMLHYLVRHLDNLPLLIVGAYRDGEFDLDHPLNELLEALNRSPHYSALNLNRLDEVSVRRMLTDLWQQPVPEAWVQAVYERTGGNPFYIKEIAKMLIDEGQVTLQNGQWRFDAVTPLKLPQKIRDITLRRVKRTSSATQDLLQLAAVIGPQFNFADLLAASDQAEADMLRSLDEAMSRNLIRESDTGPALCFSNVEIQQVVYESLSQLRRRRLHQHIGETLITQYQANLEPIAGQIAYHFIQASHRENSFIYSLKAGQHAESMHAYQTALRWYQQAAGLLSKRNDAKTMQIELFQGLGKMLQVHARYAEAAASYDKLYRVAEETDDPTAMVRSLYQLSSVNNTQGDHQAALEAARKAERAARAAKTRDLLAAALFEQGWALMQLGHLEEASAVGEQALSFSQLIDAPYEVAQSLKLLAAIQNSMGNYQQSIDFKQQALAIYRELGQKNQVAVMLNNIGESCRLRFDYTSARSLYSEALSIAREIGDRDHEIWYLSNLAGAQIGLKEYVAAETNLRQVLEMPESSRSPILSETYRFLAEAVLGQGKIDEAVAQAQLALALAEENKIPERIGQSYRTLGRVAAALPTSLPIQDQNLTPDEYFAKSLEIFAKLGMAAESARTYESWADHERSRDNQAEADTLQQQAQEIYDKLGIRK